MIGTPTLFINGVEHRIEGERNLLELIRKAGVEIPTFCYHSELSVYGACRLCIVEVEGRGIVPSCSIEPEPGLRVRTHTKEVRRIRRITLELLLADHTSDCTTCDKSRSCDLQTLAQQLGVETVRFRRTREPIPVDRSSPSLVRDPNKCVLCGDCVRACREIQSIGAIDFAHRGASVQVLPAFGKNLSDVECVHCGQCARVCPTGALTPRSVIGRVWEALEDAGRVVVVQVAPAVRVAVGEAFRMEPGAQSTGQMAAALRRLGFDRVFDTCFAADLTVIEESNEFLRRRETGGVLPLFTSCCPGWVRFAELYYPDLLPHLSTCKSPQQMFGSLAKAVLPAQLGIDRDALTVVSVMPCTAKKAEAALPRFQTEGRPDVDFVLTTQELVRMIREAGIRFEDLPPDSLDQPFGFKTGAGVIFGASGGVSEAVLRYLADQAPGVNLETLEFRQVRGEAGLREAEVRLMGERVRVAVVHGLANARRVAERVRAGEADYALVEVMACPGGCVGGAGQPVTRRTDAVARRARGLYETDRMLQFHKAQDNHEVAACYRETLGEPGGARAHDLLHTHYHNQRRIAGETLTLSDGAGTEPIPVSVCVGTNCHLRGSQAILRRLMQTVEAEGLTGAVEVQATFCMEQCDRGPSVTIGGRTMEKCTYEMAWLELENQLRSRQTEPADATGCEPHEHHACGGRSGACCLHE